MCQTVVLPDGHGKSTDTLFFRDSVSEPEIGHARPLLYPDSRPEPAARRAANPSIERERDAHLHSPLLLWRSQRRFKAQKSPPGYGSTPTGLKRLKTQNTASYDCNAKWERPYLALPNLYTSANSFRKKNSSTLPTLGSVDKKDTRIKNKNFGLA